MKHEQMVDEEIERECQPPMETKCSECGHYVFYAATEEACVRVHKDGRMKSWRSTCAGSWACAKCSARVNNDALRDALDAECESLYA